MPAQLRVPEEMCEPLAAFVSAEGIPVRVVCTGDAAVTVVGREAGPAGDAGTLRAGGWIACAAALAAAHRLRIEPGQMGRLLDRLDIKVRHCQLGLFR